MRELRYDLSCSPADEYSNEQGREYHGDAKPFERKAPTGVFDQPEQDVHILHPAKFGRYGVEFFVRHS